MSDDQHLRSMSDSAPLYALLILCGMAAGFAIFVWGLYRLMF